MIITKKTKLREVIPLITNKNIEYLLEQTPAVEYKSILSMTICEFDELVSNESDYIETHIIRRERYFLQAFGKIKHLRAQMEQLNKFIGRFERKSTAEENQAKRGVLFPSLVQRMLIDVTKFFGLKSFDEAEKVKVADWLLVFQNEAATNLFNYNLQKIFEQKAKLKQRKK